MTIATVTYHRENDSWWADSPDVHGFTAVGASIVEVRGLVHEGLPFYLDDDDVEIAELLPSGAPLVGPAAFTDPNGRWFTTSTNTGESSTAITGASYAPRPGERDLAGALR